jgi:hypothetical protein
MPISVTHRTKAILSYLQIKKPVSIVPNVPIVPIVSNPITVTCRYEDTLKFWNEATAGMSNQVLSSTPLEPLERLKQLEQLSSASQRSYRMLRRDHAEAEGGQ